MRLNRKPRVSNGIRGFFFPTMYKTSIFEDAGLRLRRRLFSLVEIIVALAVFAVLMLMLLETMSALQKTWSLTRSTARIYENSRLVFELLERDLRSSITSTIADKNIGFYIGDPEVTDASDCLVMTFVSAGEPSDAASSRLREISYRFHTDVANQTSSNPAFVFQRQVTSDNLEKNWDFTGRPDNWHLNTIVDAASASEEAEPAAFQPVVEGVASLDVVCYDADNTVIPADTDTLSVPHRIEITIQLFDEKIADDMPESVRFQKQRAFTKVFFLGDLQTN